MRNIQAYQGEVRDRNLRIQQGHRRDYTTICAWLSEELLRDAKHLRENFVERKTRQSSLSPWEDRAAIDILRKGCQDRHMVEWRV